MKKKKPRSYLSAEQKTGDKLIAESVFNETIEWLKFRGSVDAVPKTLIEQFAMSYARYVYCEDQLSKHGLLTRHPQTGEPLPNPFHKMAIDYCKQATSLWIQIKSFADNFSSSSGVDNPFDNMEQLLRRVK